MMLTSLGAPLLVLQVGSGAMTIWLLAITVGLPLGRLCRGAGMGAWSWLYLVNSGSLESDSFGNVRERMLQGRSSVSYPTRPRLFMSSKVTNPLGLWAELGLLAVRLVVWVLGGDGLWSRETETLFEASDGDAGGGGRG